MKRIFPLIACIGALFLAACDGDSRLPDPTGKGSIRAINAIPGSPVINLSIEERFIAGVRYKESTAPVPYDDFNYTFNFDVAFPGDTAFTRVASQTLKVEASRDHILMLSGDINAPTVTIWNGDERTWDGSETVFEARFSHASASLGDIDVYLDAPGTAPGTNPPVATLSFGEIVGPADFAEGPWVMTVTAAGDLNTVYFTSRESNLLPQFAHVFTVFDGDGNDTAPVAVRSMTSVGNPLNLTDVGFPPEIRFIHTAYTLGPVDVYDDELLTNLVVPNLMFKGATVDFDTAVETKTYYFTPANSTAMVLFDQEITAPAPGTFTHVYAVGDTDAWIGARLVPDRASQTSSAKVRIFHGAVNFSRFDVYVQDRGVVIADEDTAIILGATYLQLTPRIQIVAGSYDLYLTELGNKTEIAGPYPIDVALGDIVDLIAVDTVDPAVLELVDVPLP